MRVFARAGALAALVLSALVLSGLAGAPATADTAASKFDTGHQFVVVTFANDPYRPPARAGSTGRRYAGGSYGLAEGARSNAHRVAATYSLRQVASWPIKQLGVHCVVYEIPDSRSITEVLATLTRDPRITLAQPLQEFHTLTSETAPGTYNDPLYGLQTNLAALDIPAAHQRAQGAGIKVALIDTGVDTTHPDLRERISGTRSFVTADSLTPAAAALKPTAAASSYRHGTAMAGLIAAVANNKVGIVGIAPLARIEVFEACWQLKPNSDAAACNTFTLAQALAAALEARIPLINLSIAGPADPLLSALVQSGLKRGVIFVGSAADVADAFPTNIHGVIGAANSDDPQRAQGQHDPGPHDQGNGGEATLAAPATHVLTLRPDAQYDFESGTSVAAAELTGVAALLLSANNHLTADSIVSLLKSTAGPAMHSGSIDVNAALAKVEAERGGRLARFGH
jgi:subtilisin family serine protease